LWNLLGVTVMYLAPGGNFLGSPGVDCLGDIAPEAALHAMASTATTTATATPRPIAIGSC
jgi:hypothetical protein